MFYFIRNIILYLAFFVVMAFGVQWGLQTYYLPQQDGVDAPRQIFTMPQLNIQSRQTESGLFLAGLSAQNRRDWDNAWQFFSTLNEKYDDNPSIALRSFTLALGSGEYGDALNIAHKLSEGYLADKTVKNNHGEGYDLIRLMILLDRLKIDPETDITAVEDDFQSTAIRAIVTDDISGSDLPSIANAFHDVAKNLLQQRAIDSALLFARMAAFIDPNLESIYVTIGNILKYQGQADDAIEAYQKIGQDDPLYDLAVTNYIDILLDKEALDMAEDILNARIEFAPNNALYHYLMGGVLREQKEYEASITSYNVAERLGKDEDGVLAQDLWPLYYARAIAYDFNDQWNLAEADLMVAMDKFPNNPIILNYLGYAYADKNINLEKAKEMISMAVMAAPNDEYIIDSMGWILYRMGFYDEAVTYLERAASIRPYHMVINDHLGDAYWKVGRRIEAHYMWQRALDYYDPTNEEQQRMIDETRRKVSEGMLEQ